jgi:ATP-dependent DNA helicase UvrD/PcrA
LEAARGAWDIKGFSKGTAAKVAAFVEIIDRIAAVVHGDLEEVIGTALEASGYRAALAESDEEQDQNRLANIEELLTDARQFDEQNPDGGKLEEYLERSWLVNETDNWDTDTDKTTLMTLHAAKGLEFPVVFVVAVEDGVLPHERIGQHPDELEEERRLAFVGVTRAKEELQLSYAVTRDFRGVRRRTIPSSFLMEMPRQEMAVLDAVNDFDAVAFDPWDDPEDGEGDDSWDFQLDDVSVTAEGDDHAKPAISVASASITTAAALERSGATAGRLPSGRSSVSVASATDDNLQPSSALSRVSPDAFKQGMTVTHPEYGPGKIVALSGSGKNRRAMVQFAAVGEKKIILAHSAVRPAR